jgi:hypothetical protein
MRVLISSCSSFWISPEAVLLARSLGAEWAKTIALWEEEGFLGDTQKPDDIEITDQEWRKHEEYYSLPDAVPRHDPHLLAVFQELGGERMAGFRDQDRIEVVEVPDDIEYSIHSYCGEWVEERHRCWDAQQGEHPDHWRYFTKDSVYDG